MRINEKRRTTSIKEIPIGIQCDVCKKKFTFDKDVLETQEFVEISFIGGFGSIFGDQTKVHLDICQKCLKDKLGSYLTLT